MLILSIDNTNRDVETRKEYIDLCKKFNVPIRYLFLLYTEDLKHDRSPYQMFLFHGSFRTLLA